MDIDLIFKIAWLIVAVGISIKAIKAISGFVFKMAFILLIVLLVYKMFI
ncbi:hypothetical protein [Romboutsia sp.]|nr:hypothetical protein [Romboutsia sp.]HSQ89599.1 hypothetical protein [Romboutsia sp.]